MLVLAFCALEQFGRSRDGTIESTWLATDHRHDGRFGS